MLCHKNDKKRNMFKMFTGCVSSLVSKKISFLTQTSKGFFLLMHHYKQTQQ